MKLKNAPGYQNARRISARERLKSNIKTIHEGTSFTEQQIKGYENALKSKLPEADKSHMEGLLKDAKKHIDDLTKQLKPRQKELESLDKTIVTPDVARARRTKKAAEGRKKPQGRRSLLSSH